MIEILYEKDLSRFLIVDDAGNLNDVTSDLEKEVEVYGIISEMLNTEYLFDSRLIDKEVEDIYILVIEKAYSSDKQYHRLDMREFEFKDSIKQKVLIAYNKFTKARLEQKFGNAITIENLE